MIRDGGSAPYEILIVPVRPFSPYSGGPGHKVKDETGMRSDRQTATAIWLEL